MLEFAHFLPCATGVWVEYYETQVRLLFCLVCWGEAVLLLLLPSILDGWGRGGGRRPWSVE